MEGTGWRAGSSERRQNFSGGDNADAVGNAARRALYRPNASGATNRGAIANSPLTRDGRYQAVLPPRATSPTAKESAK